MFANYDCLIIHLDADIALEKELLSLALAAPCPPARETCDLIRTYVASLLGGNLSLKVVLCVPAQCTEAWIVAALYPDEAAKFAPIECRNEPERLLIQKPDKLVRDKDGTAKKQVNQYKKSINKLVAGWSDAVTACAEAPRFEAECRDALSKM